MWIKTNFYFEAQFKSTPSVSSLPFLQSPYDAVLSSYSYSNHTDIETVKRESYYLYYHHIKR